MSNLLTALNFNTNDRISGSVVVLLSPTDNRSVSRQLGNVKSASYTLNDEHRDRMVKICGRDVHQDTITTKIAPTSTIKIEDLDRANLALMLRGEDGTAINQPELTSLAVDSIALAPSVDQIHSITQDGEQVYNISSLILESNGATLVEGTDYVVISKRQGTIRFLITQAQEVTVEVTAQSFNNIPMILSAANQETFFVTINFYPTRVTANANCEPELVIQGVAVAKHEGSLEIATEQDSELDLMLQWSGQPQLIDFRD